MRTPVFAASIASLALAAPAAAGPAALPRSVVASESIRRAMETFERTGVFALPAADECVAAYHPLENTLWNLHPPPAPECPNGASAAGCISAWFATWRDSLNKVSDAWGDAYCNCKCCYEEGGFESSAACIAAMEDVFEPEFQLILDRYNAFNPGSCCPVER